MRDTTLHPETRRLRQLPDDLINRIAAGEVIERPAAAVKELVENAIDAGAKRISVSIAGGGIARIEVLDDGCGLSEADLPLAVLRHCTSKLPGDALDRIMTLGFRGEALPSIGAVARLRVCSRPPGAANAFAIRLEGGVCGAVEPSAGVFGTRVTVEDLFYATPARRKFLKSERAEADQCEAAVRRLAYAAPHVAFRFEHASRVAFDVPRQSWKARVAALLAPAEIAALLPQIDGERAGMQIEALVCNPAATRATTAGQSLVVNGRPVADPVLRTALKVAFRDVIDFGRHPIGALVLTVPPESIDVNVHPAKNEVRFRDPDAVRSLVIGTLKRALAVGAGLAVPRAAPPRPIGYSGPVFPSAPSAPRQSALMEIEPSARTVPALEPEAAAYPLGAPLAQVLDTYIIALAADGGLVLVDQHAAHERLTHEALVEQHQSGGVVAQDLLIPDVVEMSSAAAARLMEHAPALAHLGFRIDAFGLGAVLVHSVPAVLTRHGAPDTAALLRDVADELEDSGVATAIETRLDAAIARLACHGSIRAGRRLRPEEMNALLRQMEATPRAATCSHGRPTVLKLSKAEIGRLFGRT